MLKKLTVLAPHLAFIILSLTIFLAQVMQAQPVFASTITCPNGNTYTIPNNLASSDRQAYCTDTVAPPGCYQQSSAAGASSTTYQMLADTACSNQPTYPDTGGADPTTKCYVQITALDGSKVWQNTDCTTIQQGGAPGTPPTGAGQTGNGGSTPTEPISVNNYNGPHVCGLPASKQVKISIDLGCVGEKCAKNPSQAICSTTINPIVDALYAILRFLSDGVGLVIIISIIIAGIQYTVSRGDPGATAKAIERIRYTVFALLLYLFAFALLNFLVPGGLFA